MAKEAGVSHYAHVAVVVSGDDEVSSLVSTNCVDVCVVFVRVVDTLDVPSELGSVGGPDCINGIGFTELVLLELRDVEVE